MKIYISDNGMATQDQRRAVSRALCGTWGESAISTTQTVLDMGRARLGFVSGGSVVSNDGESSLLVVALFTDGSSSITDIQPGQLQDYGKTIKTAITIAKG